MVRGILGTLVGGAYGLARVTLGFYPGFMIGCCETAEYIMYVATSAVQLAQMLISVMDCRKDLQPVICLLFYLSALYVYIFGNGRSWFWRFNMGLCILSLFVVIIYILGAAKFADLDKYAGVVSAAEVDYYQGETSLSSEKKVWFEGGMGTFLKVLPLTAWFFVGVESLSFACDETDQVSWWGCKDTATE